MALEVIWHRVEPVSAVAPARTKADAYSPTASLELTTIHALFVVEGLTQLHTKVCGSLRQDLGEIIVGQELSLMELRENAFCEGLGERIEIKA